MRGKMIYQIGSALKTITKIGESRHEAKLRNEAGIFSLSTRHEVGQRLRPLTAYCESAGLRNLENITNDDVRSYLEGRLNYHMSKENSLKTFRAELSAFRKLEEGLTKYNELKRGGSMVYNYYEIRASVSIMAKEVLRQVTSTYKDRAYPDPQGLIRAIKDPVHKLQATLQYESGCRAEGVGAPSKAGGNPITIENFVHHETGEPLGVVKDPVSKEKVGVFWTREKGGKVAYHYCPSQLRGRVIRHLGENGTIESNYKKYLQSINDAAELTGQFYEGRGCHGLRHCFAQRRFREAVGNGYSDESAKLLVSREMNHNRGDVTEVYLR